MLNTHQEEYLMKLIEQVSDEFDPTFVSFQRKDIDHPHNLVYQLNSSPYPIVLCAFLECAKYDDGMTLTAFSEVTPPSVEEVKEMLEDYNGKMPYCITVHSSLKCEPDSFFAGWEGIQYARYFLSEQKFKNLSYTLVHPACTCVVHGKGKLPITGFGLIAFKEIIVD